MTQNVFAETTRQTIGRQPRIVPAMNSTTRRGRSGVLAALRSLVPERQLAFSEALQIAELQAGRLRQLAAITSDELPEAVIGEQPRFRIVRRALPTSGVSCWDGREWIIYLNGSEPEARQRFTLLHEYKHIVDYGRTARLYGGSRLHTADAQAEQAADYFAGCSLMPKPLLKRAWGEGIQQPEALAERFEVSSRAIEVRLSQLGLSGSVDRCAQSWSGHRRVAA